MRPTVTIVSKVGDVFQKLGMLDKYQKLKKKYPPPKWEYRYIKGKRVKIRSKHFGESAAAASKHEDKFVEDDSSGFHENAGDGSDEVD